MPDEPQLQDPPEPDAVETTAPEPDPVDEPEPKKPTETVEFWKAKAREQEKRAKDNAGAAKRLSEIEESQKSEQQKLIERAEAAEQKAAALESAREIDGWKAQVAKDPKYAGITADVLRGATLEEIEDHARDLKALLPEPRQPGQVPGEGRTVTPGTGDPAQQFADLIRNARK